jgi:hypothetical protein
MVRLTRLAKREVVRFGSGWVPSHSGESEHRYRLRSWGFGRLRVIWVIVVFAGLAAWLGQIVLRGDSLGVAVARPGTTAQTFTSMLVVLTLLGFGAIGLSVAGIADDWLYLGREMLWGVSAFSQVVAKFIGAALPAFVLAVVTALFYCGRVNLAENTLTGHFFWFCLVDFILYALTCVALGLALSSLVRGIRSTVFLLMATLALFVLLSDLPFALEDLDGWSGAVFTRGAMIMPSHFAAGAWAAELRLEDVDDTGRGWPWNPTWATVLKDGVGLVIQLIVYLGIAVAAVARRAPKIVLQQ